MMEDRLVFPIPPGKHWSDEMPRILPAEATLKLEARSTKEIPNPKSKVQNEKPVQSTLGGWGFSAPAPPKAQRTRPKRTQHMKNDPALVAKTRQLRDRYLESVNAGRMLPQTDAKYQVSKALRAPEQAASRLLPAA